LFAPRSHYINIKVWHKAFIDQMFKQKPAGFADVSPLQAFISSNTFS